MSLLAATVLLGQVAGLAPRIERSVLTLSDRTELRLRDNPGTSPPLDLTSTLTSAISVTAPRVSYSIGYGLSFIAPDMTSVDPTTGGTDFLHNGRVGVTYARHRLGLTLALTGTYGTQVAIGVSAPVRLDATGPTTGTPAGTQPAGPGAPLPTYVPATQQLKTGSLGLNLGMTYALTRRWSYGINASTLAFGGIDFQSQRAVPPSRSATGSTSLGYQLTHQDTLATRLGVSYVYVLRLPDYQIPARDNRGRLLRDKDGNQVYQPLPKVHGGSFLTTDVFETWTHNLSKRAAASLGAGLSFVHSDPNEGSNTDSFFAIGNGSISYTEPLHDHATLALAGTIAVTTTYNPVLAEMQHQGVVSATATWSWHKWLAALSGAGASELPVYAPYSTRTASGTVLVGYTPADPVQLQAGVRGNTQVLHDQLLGAAPPSDWAVFLAVLLIAPPLRL